MEKLKDKYKFILILIIVFAILIRIVFVCKNTISDYQFDVGIGAINSEEDYNNLYENFEEEPNTGRHINYIMQLYTYNSLPNKIIGQFYHPPLHHFIMSSWLKISDNISSISSFKFESMQFITLIYSSLILIFLYRILKELEIEDKNKIIPMILFSFYPLYIFMSGSINNDELVTMFAILELFYLMRWQKNPSMKNVVIIALCIGLGLMTKTSMIVMLVPTIYVYFKKLIEFVNSDNSIKKLLIELLVFTVISSFLGLWFQIRSLANNLNTLGIIQPYEYLSIANESIFARFGLCNIFKVSNVNIWNYLIYSSINFVVTDKLAPYNIIMIIAVITLIADIVYFILKNRKTSKILIITLITWWISYFYLNISMPYTCSMHSRYMVLPISIGIIYLGLGMKNENNKVIKVQVYVSSIVVSLMSIFSFII